MSRKDLLEVLDALEVEGAEITRVRSGHYRVRNPITEHAVLISCTPKGRRTVLNEVSRLRRIGFLLTWKRGTSRIPRRQPDPSD